MHPLNEVYTSVACAVGPSVTMSSIDFFSSKKTWFLGIYLNFQQQQKIIT
jgi:hypothetical protein